VSWKVDKRIPFYLLFLIRRADRPCLSHDHYQPANSISTFGSSRVRLCLFVCARVPVLCCECVRRNNKQTGRLDVGGVEHDADCGTEGLGREVVAELSTDNAGVTVRAGDLAPDDPDVGTTDLTLGPVDESDLLSEVEVGGLSVVNTVDLDQTCVRVDSTL
jgi:hypothetical protein